MISVYVKSIVLNLNTMFLTFWTSSFVFIKICKSKKKDNQTEINCWYLRLFTHKVRSKYAYFTLINIVWAHNYKIQVSGVVNAAANHSKHTAFSAAKIKTTVSCFTRDFPFLALVTCFPPLVSDFMFSRAWRQLHALASISDWFTVLLVSQSVSQSIGGVGGGIGERQWREKRKNLRRWYSGRTWQFHWSAFPRFCKFSVTGVELKSWYYFLLSAHKNKQ